MTHLDAAFAEWNALPLDEFAKLQRKLVAKPAEALPVDSAELAAVRRQPESSVHVEFVADRPVQPQ
ncbi:hypothetical protein [Streptomyces sp. Tue6028]|uniref:hypothetical protein n=1 Tax=Streptomyces sp. Tue6028 TaxID=2036037 RepID=UPI003D72D522